MTTEIYQFLALDSDPNNSFNVIGNYASDPQYFLLTCPSEENLLYYELYRMLGYYEDTGNFTATGYGAGSALTNGIALHIIRDTVYPLTCVNTIKTNGGWSNFCFDADPITYGSGPNAFRLRWTFSRAGQPIRLYPGQSLGLLAQDNFSFLIQQTFQMQGKKIYGTSSEQ